MAPRRKLRKVNSVIFVFCEGETERRYVDMLRTNFRVPIQIVTKVLNTRISKRLIEAYIKNGGYPDVDQVFLFYDGDREDVAERLYSISNARVMLSCPCVELWFVLHFTEHHGSISSDNVIKLLLKHFPAYKKGEIQHQLRDVLLSSWRVAMSRAKSLPLKFNPSSTAYLLPEYLTSIIPTSTNSKVRGR